MMGLPYDPQNRSAVFVDTYATEFGRDMEPSVEAGDRIWRVATSCVQMYKAGTSIPTPWSDLCLRPQEPQNNLDVYGAPPTGTSRGGDLGGAKRIFLRGGGTLWLAIYLFWVVFGG